MGTSHFRDLFGYRLCMHMFLTDFQCLSCDHTLLCFCDSRSGGIQLCHSLLQRSLGIILQWAGIYHLEKPPHLQMEHDDAPVFRCGLGLTRPVDLLSIS